jgi:hypothetical protein
MRGASSFGSAFASPNIIFFSVFFLKTVKHQEHYIIRRKNMHLESYICVLCQLNVEEMVSHLFSECPFAKECWNLFNITIGRDSSFPEVLHDPGHPSLLGNLDS